MQVLGRAAARLPYGVPDPVLCGAAAVALYTGAFRSACALDVRADARALNAELMVFGFHWRERPPDGARGLWHPELELGIDITEGVGTLTPAERSNILTVTLDAGASEAPEPRLRVIGIEDLIVARIVRWLGQGARHGEASTVIQMLVGLGRAGIGGRLRAGYLQRRLACETADEVVLDLPTIRDGYDAGEPRATSLTAMRAVIAAWRARCGLSFDDAAPGDRGSSSSRGSPISNRNETRRRGGERPRESLVGENIVPFGVAQPGRPRTH
ncbi:MAG: hypothetical protein WBQ75_08955 [Acetobacteraceae bacterium]